MSSRDLLHALIRRLPPRFPQELVGSIRHRVETLCRDSTAPAEAIEQAIIEIGRSTWPYHRAWEEYYARAGRPMEEERFLAAFGHALRDRIRVDTNAARVRSSDIVRIPAFGRYTGEECLVIEHALLHARRDAADALSEQIASEGQREYDAAVQRWEAERLAIDGQLFTLREFAKTKPHLAAEIDRAVREYELGFSRVVGCEPSASELNRVVREYRTRDGRDE